LDLHIENTLQGRKIGAKWGRGHQILTPNESFLLTLWFANLCAKYHQNRTKIATIGARTDRPTDRRMLQQWDR